MENENSVSIILKQIKPGSKVLEFGPAMGRMTKYMKEQLSCEVFIVEVDEEGYESAIQYAVNGYLGNAETNLWAQQFKDIRFDYITFADVIEHLREPEKVIMKARGLLATEGKLIISVPNIAHNSIIIDLINNKFNYRDIGLLDNTHIKFFTYYTLQDMLSKCNMIITNERATYAQPNETEFLNNYDMVSKELADKLKSKEFGDVYQYVFTSIRKEDYVRNKENIITHKSIKKLSAIDTFKVYSNDGSGLNENNVIIKNIYMGRNNLSFSLDNFTIENEIRLDFTEESCIVNIDSIKIDDMEYDIKNLSGNYSFSHENYYIFLGNDPNLYLQDIPKQCTNFSIEFTIEKLYSSTLEVEYIKVINDMLMNSFKQNENYKKAITDKLSEKEKEILGLKQELEKKDNEILGLKQELEESSNKLNGIISDKEDIIETLQNEGKQKDETIINLKEVIEKINSKMFNKIRSRIFKR